MGGEVSLVGQISGRVLVGEIENGDGILAVGDAVGVGGGAAKGIGVGEDAEAGRRLEGRDRTRSEKGDKSEEEGESG